MDRPVTRRKNIIKVAAVNTTTPKRPAEFMDLVKSFLTECRAKNLSGRTIQFYEENLVRMKKMFDEQRIPLNVTTLTAREIKHHYVGRMIENGLASNTINGRIKSCKAFFKYLFEEGIVPHNLAEEIKLVKAEKKMIQTFTKEQVVALLQQPDKKTFTGLRDYTMMVVMLETGMRIGELLHLKVDDVFLKELELRIQKGKGGKARRVPIQKTCAKILKQYLGERGDAETDALFISIDEAPLHIRTFQENVQEYGKKAGITGVRVSPHTFRHTMAKFYILNGGDVFTLQQILGHSTLDMVRYYVELFSKDIKEQHQKYSPVEHMARYRNVI